MFALLYFFQRTKTSDCIQQPDQQSRTDHFAQTYQQTRQLSLSRPPYSPDHFHVGMTTRPDHTYPPLYKTSSYKVGLILMVHRLFKAVINNIAALRQERIATFQLYFMNVLVR